MAAYRLRRATMARLFLAACTAVPALAGPGYGQTLRPALQFGTARLLEEAALKCAAEKGYAAAVAVFDDAGRLVTFARADGASTATGEVALWKGRSAAEYRFSTRQTGKWNVPTAPNIATAPGGLPLLAADGTAIGGVGVSGGPADADEACAAAGIAAARLGTVSLK